MTVKWKFEKDLLLLSFFLVIKFFFLDRGVLVLLVFRDEVVHVGLCLLIAKGKQKVNLLILSHFGPGWPTRWGLISKLQPRPQAFTHLSSDSGGLGAEPDSANLPVELDE